ncbi:proteasome subunit beta [Allokutzneria multivorans]|uniref:Proteasome subunit beta n=1 Tax=Allokutzneria multivorans TaxID=1142134 RepID=A0ABP7U283_9PSEU
MDNPSARSYPGAALPSAFFTPGVSSFSEFLQAAAPELLPGRRHAPGGALHGSHGGGRGSEAHAPHGTTIVALVYDGGVLIAGDRRATMGNVIAQRDMEKVFLTDEYSAVGIAGAAGLAVEMVRLFTVELRHYEKLEGVPLSLDGKANKLATMLRGNLDAAMAGLAVLPLFVGYDLDERRGRIVSYDVTGGRYDEHGGYHAVGSGSVFAKGALKKRHEVSADRDTAVRNAVEALYDAADDDSATSGPDLTRRIYPIVATVEESGSVRLGADEVAEVAEAVVRGRHERPGG